MSPERRSLFLNLAVLAVAVVIFAGLLEIALRVIYARSLDFSMEMWKYAVSLKQPVEDPRLSFVHVPNRSAFLMGVPVSINSSGFRDRDYTEAKPAGVYRIIMLGDSTTFGWGVPIEQTVAKILERELNAARIQRFEVINGGVGNYDTVQEVEQYVMRDRLFDPDLVILQYFINDPEPVPLERQAGVLGRSYLFAFTFSRFDGILRLTGLRPRWREYYASLYNDSQPGFVALRRAFEALGIVSHVSETKVLVALLPELHQINANYPFAAEHRKIRDLLAADEIPTMELIDGLRGHGPENELWVTPADTHPNGKANALVAAQLRPWILQHLR